MTIDWNRIDVKVKIIKSENFNPLNPYSNLTSKERVEELINISLNIRARYT